MRCPNCKEDTLIRAGQLYICKVCTKPTFKPEEVEGQFNVEPFDNALTGHRIEIINHRVSGFFKLECIGNSALKSFKTNKVINDYHLLDNRGRKSVLRIYEGDYQPHYYHYLNGGEYVFLKKEEFKIYE